MNSKILLTFILQLFCYYNVQALTENLDNGLTHNQPMIAMLCGQHGKFHNQYLNDQKQWVTDNDPSATCIKDKLEILEYCRKVYPKKDIRNIVESNHYYEIDNWRPTKFSNHYSKDKKHYVKPIRCLEGNFQSDALLVPEHCIFDHIHNSSICESNSFWNQTATKSCRNKNKALQSYAMLLPCGVGIFNGVEFVCCPSTSQNEILDNPIYDYKTNENESKKPAYLNNESNNESKLNDRFNKKKKMNKKHLEKLIDEDEDNSSFDNESDDENEQEIYESRYLNKDDSDTDKKIRKNSHKKPSKINQENEDEEYYEDDYEEKENDVAKSTTSTTTTTTTTTTTETPLEHYYSHFDSKNEHNLFKLAEESLKKIQLDKMKKVFKDYAEFQTKLNDKNFKKSKKNLNKNEDQIDENLRKKMEKRYEDALESLETLNNEEKQQLNAMHQQRVLTLINMKKQEATDCYTSALNQTPLKPIKVQKCLEKLIKSLEKDRIHTLHHYKHLLMINSKLALKEKAATLTHLENLIVIANRSISMLNKYPSLNYKIRNHIIATWHNSRGVPIDQTISKETEQAIMEKYEEETAQKQQEKERRKMIQEVRKEEKIESESKSRTSTNKNEPIKEIEKRKNNLKHETTTQKVSIENIDKQNKANSNTKHTTHHPSNSKVIKNTKTSTHQMHSVNTGDYKPITANMQSSRVHHDSNYRLSEQLPEQHHLKLFESKSNKHAFITFSIAGIAILLALISGIVLYRSNTTPSRLSQGFVALQQQQFQQTNNDQQNVESLQINGYENPTYKYFESNVI